MNFIKISIFSLLYLSVMTGCSSKKDENRSVNLPKEATVIDDVRTLTASEINITADVGNANLLAFGSGNIMLNYDVKNISSEVGLIKLSMDYRSGMSIDYNLSNCGLNTFKKIEANQSCRLAVNINTNVLSSGIYPFVIAVTDANEGNILASQHLIQVTDDQNLSNNGSLNPGVACKQNYHLSNRTCQANVKACSPMPQDALTGTQIWNGSSFNTCQISACSGSKKIFNNSCIDTSRSCLPMPDNATTGTQLLTNTINGNNIEGSSLNYSACTINSCASLYMPVNNICKLIHQERSCYIENGNGLEISEDGGQNYGSCQLSGCISTFHPEGQNCVSDTRLKACDPSGVITSLPLNAYFSVIGGQNFSQTYSEGVWSPESVVLNNGTGSCGFQCNMSYTYNSINNTCVENYIEPDPSALVLSKFTSEAFYFDPMGSAEFKMFFNVSSSKNPEISLPSFMPNPGTSILNYFKYGSSNSTTNVYPKKMTLGKEHGCMIASDSSAYCWGSNAVGQLGNNSNINSFIPVKINMSGALSGLTIKDMVSAEKTTCVIASNDQVYCWGSNTQGEIGSGTNNGSFNPQLVLQGDRPSLTAKKISMFYASSSSSTVCVIGSDDKAYCWGEGRMGQLGNNAILSANVPKLVVAGANTAQTYKEITASCGIGTDNRSYCWGDGGNGQLGNGATAQSNVPVLVSQGVMPSLSVKKIHRISTSTVCVIHSNDQVYCWGATQNGSIGNGASGFNTYKTPIALAQGARPSLTVKDMMGGENASCVIASNDKLYCWGGNVRGTVGNGTYIDVLSPVAINGGSIGSLNVKQVTGSGYLSTCAITSDNKGHCWGLNTSGQLGINSQSLLANTPSSPVAIKMTGTLPTNLSIEKISKSAQHGCFIASDSSAYCWGSNAAGQLGDNISGLPIADYISQNSLPKPVVMTGELTSLYMKNVAVGNIHSCAIASNDKVYCWGAGTAGQLGNGLTTNVVVPSPVDMSGALSGLTVKKLGVGSNHNCVIASNDQVYCWGTGAQGQLGNAASVQSNIPVAVNTSGVLNGLTIKKLEVGENHNCVIASNDKAYCWGQGSSGQLGNAASVNSNIPVSVNTSGVLNNLMMRQISIGSNFTCAIASDNQAYCWGAGTAGQLGNNALLTSNIPVKVFVSGVLNGLNMRTITSSSNHTCALDSSNMIYCWGTGFQGQLGNGLKINSSVPVLNFIIYNSLNP